MKNTGNDIYNTAVSEGVALAWVNSYSAVVVKTSGATLLFDPVGMELPSDVSLDLIAISHGHSDHWEPSLVTELQGRTGSAVAAAPSLTAKLGQSGAEIPPTPLLKRRPTEDILSLVPGDEIEVRGTTVSALRCDHAAEEPLAFRVRSPDGVTVYLPGDTTPFPELERLPKAVSDKRSQEPETGSGVDVLCWMGTALTDGAEIARLVQPRVFLSYAITPPAAGERAYGILTGLTPEIPFRALDRHQVFLWPNGG